MTTISADGASSTIYIQDIYSAIQYRINTGAWVAITFPVFVSNTNSTPASNILKVIFTTQITLNTSKGDTLCYFDCSSNGLQFGSASLDVSGNRASIVIDGIANYIGLIQNRGISTGYNNIYIYNLAVTAASSVTDTQGGWVCGAQFGRGAYNNYIINCASDGIIRGGGIVGEDAATGPSSLYVIGCYSTGTIGSNKGGIIGSSAARNSSAACSIEQCWSEGNIFPSGGGIYGTTAGIGGGSVVARKCYSTGTIASSAGGIYGFRAALTNGTALAESCYSTGSIGTNGGGIYGASAGLNSGQCSTTNCYTLGTIDATAGGIFGAAWSAATASNCYISGAAAAATGYIFAGSTAVPATNYSEAANLSSGWDSTHANTALQGTPPTSSIWAYSGVNQPYELVLFGYTPYSRDIVVGNALVQNYAQTVVAGGSTVNAVKGSSFSIVGGITTSTITINVNTGVISTTTATPAGTYTIYVRNQGSYSITTFTLTVSAPPTPPAPPAPPALPVAPRPRPTGNVATQASASTTAARYKALAGGYQKGVRAPNADPSVLWNITGVYCPCPGP
jgi:hypothetical protein